jgi:hypothetical protein
MAERNPPPVFRARLSFWGFSTERFRGAAYEVVQLKLRSVGRLTRNCVVCQILHLIPIGMLHEIFHGREAACESKEYRDIFPFLQKNVIQIEDTLRFE